MGVNLRLLAVVLGLWGLLVVRDVLLGPLGVHGVDQLLLARGPGLADAERRRRSCRCCAAQVR